MSAEIVAMRDAADKAETALRCAVIEACPGPHYPVQHRDRKPPWCHVCGCTARGEKVRDTSKCQTCKGTGWVPSGCECHDDPCPTCKPRTRPGGSES